MSKRPREIPHHSELVEYSHAVAGHEGTMCDESGEFFFKPVHQQEVDFYESAFRDHRDFADVMPLFHGTLTHREPSQLSSSNGSTTPKSTTASDAERSKEEWVPNKNRRLNTHQYVVLENASKGYKHANILDAKLGYRLWADDAPKAKKVRFDQIAEETTHKNFGFRIAGMRIYHAKASVPEMKDGKKPAFQVDGDYKIYDRDFGRNYVNDDNLKDVLKSYVFNEAAGITEDLGKAVCEAFVRDLERIRDALENEESRMYSASCLFVFEGDGQTLLDNIGTQNMHADKINAKLEGSDILGACRQDSGIGLDEGESGDEEELDDESDEEEMDQRRTCSVQLIDFAHAKWTPGQGPDENSLKGVRSLIQIFKELAA